MTYLDAKSFRWPKEASGKPESGGLAQAQPVDSLSPFKGNLVKPMAFKHSFEGQASWAVGESSRGSPRQCTGSPVPAEIPASMREVSGSPAALANATVGSFVGFSDAVVLPVQAAISMSTRGFSGRR